MRWARVTRFAAALLIEVAFARGAHAQDTIEVVPQTGHSYWVKSVAISPDGKRVLSGGHDGTIKLWDADSGVLLRTFPEGHSLIVYAVAFSPDGRQVLSGGLDSTIKLWDARTGELLRTFRGHSKSVTAVAFSPDGRQVRSASSDMVKFWDAASGELQHTLENDAGVWAFSPDGRQVLSGSHPVKLWDAATGALLRTFEKGHSTSVASLAFSPDGRHAVSSSQELKLWDAVSGALLRNFDSHSEYARSVAFSPDGQHVLSGGREVKLWNAWSGALLRTFPVDNATVHSVAFSSDGRQVLAGSGDSTLRLWDMTSGALLRTFEGNVNGVSSVAFSPNSWQLLAASYDNTIKLWDAASGALLRIFEGHSEPVLSAAFSPDGRHALSGSQDMTLKLWDAVSGSLLRTFEGHSKPVSSVAFSPNGRHVLSGSHDDTIKLWDAGMGKLVRTFSGSQTYGVNAVAFSPDGRKVLSGHADGTMKIWDALSGKLWDSAAGRQLQGFRHSDSAVQSVAFSPDGQRVVSGGWDKTLKLWDAATGALLRTFEAHAEFVKAVAFSSDGRHVLSGSQDSTIKLWDVASGALVRTFLGHSGQVISVAFSPDGSKVFSGGLDTTLRIWNRATGQQLVSLVAKPNGEWLAINPDGFIAAGRDAGDLLTIVRGFDVTKIGQVHQSLFNPDLVREALAGDPTGEVREAGKIVNLKKVLDSGPAPLVAITSHTDGSQSNTELVTLKTRITDRGKGVGRIEWRVNGVTAAVATKPTGSGPDYVVSQVLGLDPGKNSIEVVTYNASNLLASLSARTTVTYTAPANAVKPTLHILAIGINAYVDRGWAKDPGSQPIGFAPLKLAVKDANTFAADLKEAASALYADVRVTTAFDADASRAGLETIVNKLAREVQQRDTFILFVAAHGTSEQGRFYLIPQDFQHGPDALAKRAISQEVLQDWLANRIKARKALILLDTCESGALVAGHSRSRTEGAASEAAVGRLHELTGRPVLTAAATGKPAWEGYKGHGVFTYALLEALRNGDANQNGTIELREIAGFVQDRVPKLSAELGGAGRAAVIVTRSTSSAADGQSARFGSRGEDFVVARRLQ